MGSNYYCDLCAEHIVLDEDHHSIDCSRHPKNQRITQLEADKRVLGFDKGLLVETLHQCIVKSESQHKLLRGFIDEVIAQVKGDK